MLSWIFYIRAMKRPPPPKKGRRGRHIVRGEANADNTLTHFTDRLARGAGDKAMSHGENVKK